MINYSLVLRRKNISDKTSPLFAYATAQCSDTMELSAFSKHIADHGSVYSRADITAILIMAVDCMRELLLQGKKIKLGDLGNFSVALHSKGAESAAKFNPANDITSVKVKWEPGSEFCDLLADATFNAVATRAAQAATLKAEKSGATTVDLTEAKKSGTSSGADTTTDSGSSSSNSGTSSSTPSGGGSSSNDDDDSGM